MAITIRKGIYLLVIFFLVGCMAFRPSRPIHLGGWITYWDFAKGMEAINHPPAMLVLDDIYFFAVHLDADGTPLLVGSPESYNQAVDRVKTNKKNTWMTVVNDVVSSTSETPILKDPHIIHALLSDPERRQKHQQQIVSLAVKHGFTGVDVDYENLFHADYRALSLFIHDLAQTLKAQGLLLSVTVQPTLNEKNIGHWEEICKSADRLQIMLYNLHSTKTGPGPMATPAWITKILWLAAKKCSLNKIVPVLKVSGMQWSPTRIDGIQHEQAVELAKQVHAKIFRDPNGNVPYFTYSTAEGVHTVFYEDAASLLEKISTLKSLRYEKVLFWSLGRHDPTLFSRLAEVREKGEL